MDVVFTELSKIGDRLAALETAIDRLTMQKLVKEWYSTTEIAQLLGKAEFTVREWCRLNRINAKKRSCGRGPIQEWSIAHSEYLRIQNEGLLPISKN